MSTRSPITPRVEHGPQRLLSSRKQTTSLQAVGIDELGQRRLQNTPRVFLSTKDGGTQEQRRELRATLLPVILRLPGSGYSDPALPIPEAAAATVDLASQARPQDRSKTEKSERSFLELDGSNQRDPLKVAATSCTALKELSERLMRPRVAPECMLNLDTSLLFQKGSEMDLQELSSLLTIDLERMNSFRGNEKRPGIISLQIASRVPLTVKDPIHGASMESRLLESNDVYALRMDLNSGEVRHIDFNLGSNSFLKTPLASRMAALVNPEKGALAGLVQLLRNKDSTARGLAQVCSDICRDIAEDLPPLEDPSLEEVLNQASSSQARLEELLKGPRASLRRLLDATDAAAAALGPLLPSLAQALDALAIICIREVDRLATRCHSARETLLSRWAADSQKQKLEASARAQGLKSEGAERSHLSMLETELVKQETVNARLLEENFRLEDLVVRGNRTETQLRGQLAAMQKTIEELRAERKTLLGMLKGEPPAAATLQEQEAEPTMLTQAFQAEPQAEPEDLEEHRRMGSKKITKLKERIPVKASALAMCMSTAVQTKHSYIFSKTIPLEDELSNSEYDDLLVKGTRLLQILCRYEWHSLAGLYILSAASDDAEKEMHEVSNQPGPGGSNRRQEILKEMAALRLKVEQSQQRARNLQLEAEVTRLQAATKLGFETWVATLCKEAGSLVPGAITLPLNPSELFAAVIELVEKAGMQIRIAELEDNLEKLVPVAVRGHGSETGEKGFWQRVMRVVRRIARPRLRSWTDATTDELPTASAGSNFLVLDTPRLEEELHAIWAAVAPPATEVSKTASAQFPPTFSQVLQNCVKTFYLRRFGRAKHMEAAAVGLCYSIIDNRGSLFASLFGVLCKIRHDDAELFVCPSPLRDVQQELGLDLDPRRLEELPVDAVHLIAGLIKELRGIELTANQKELNQKPEEWELASFRKLPLQDVLAAAQRVFTRNKYFQLMLLAFAEFPLLQMPTRRGSTILTSVVTSTMVVAEPRASSDSGELEDGLSDSWRGSDKLPVEVVFVSHLLLAHLRGRPVGTIKATQTKDQFAEVAKEEALKLLWHRMMKEASRSRAATTLYEIMKLESQAQSCPLPIAVSVLASLPSVQVPAEILSRSLVYVSQHFEAPPGELTLEMLQTLISYSSTFEDVTCVEGLVLWAALWALALERSQEMQLLGELFTKFDTSMDGSLQLEEFASFLGTFAPDISTEQCERIFLASVEDGSSDMTKEVFLNVVSKLSITADIALMEHILQSRGQTMAMATDQYFMAITS